MVMETRLKEGVEPMIQQAPAFTTKYLDEEKEETGGEILSLRFNEQNRAWLDIIKWYLHESKDATAIKYAIELAKNDLQSKFSEATWRKISSDLRRKPEMKRPRSLEI